MDNLLDFLFDESELEELAISPITINNVMDLDDLENLCTD